MIDEQSVKEFWENRAEMPLSQEQINFVGNNDNAILRHELEKIKLLVEIYVKPTDVVLDLGAGWGRLVLQLDLYSKASRIVEVDFCEGLVNKGRWLFDKLGIQNVEFIQSCIGAFQSEIKFDAIIISGVLLYLNDTEIDCMIENMRQYSKCGTRLYIRDNTGVEGRFTISKIFSQELNSEYSAIYRTREEIIDIFTRAGFNLIHDEDMFEGELNKRKETRSRLYVLEKK